MPSARQHGLEGIEQRNWACGLGDEAARAGGDGGAHGGGIVRGRQYDDREQGPVAPQFGQQIEAARTWQREVEHHQRTIGMAGEKRQRFLAVGCTHHLEPPIERRQHLLERVQNERMVVYDEYFHCAPRDGAQETPGARREPM